MGPSALSGLYGSRDGLSLAHPLSAPRDQEKSHATIRYIHLLPHLTSTAGCTLGQATQGVTFGLQECPFPAKTMQSPWPVFSLLKIKCLIFCISKIEIVEAVPCALQRGNGILHRSYLTPCPQEEPPIATVGRSGFCGCFVTDLKPMETPMGHLKIKHSQQANQFGSI